MTYATLADGPPPPLPLAQLPRSRRPWLLLEEPVGKMNRALWFELSVRWNILARPDCIERPVTTAIICPDLAELERHAAVVLEHGGLVFVPPFPYQDRFPGHRPLDACAADHPTLDRLLCQGRVVVWNERTMQPAGVSKPVDPFTLSGMVALVASLGCARAATLFARPMETSRPQSVLQRRHASLSEVLAALDLRMESLLDPAFTG